MSFADKILKTQGNTSIKLVLTPFPDDRHAWYFVRVNPAKMPMFERQVTSGPTDLTEYGEVIRSGWGKRPPAEVVETMREEYGYHD